MTLPLAQQPRDLLLGPDNDLVVSGSDLQFSRGVPSVAQSCRIALQMFKEEWFLDLDQGIPYFDAILGAKPTVGIRAATIAFRQALQNVDGVLDILELDVEFVSARRLDVTFQVRTALGDTVPDTIAVSVGGG